MTDDERLALLALGDAQYILYQYYIQSYSDVKRRDELFMDEKTAELLGWSERRGGNVRRQLQKAGWYYRVSGRFTDGYKFSKIFLGKDVIEQHLKGMNNENN